MEESGKLNVWNRKHNYENQLKSLIQDVKNRWDKDYTKHN